MKQRITVDQLNELTDQQKEKLREWWKPKKYDLYIDFTNRTVAKETYVCMVHHEKWPNEVPLLSIGQMIEILRQKHAHQLTVIFWNMAYCQEDEEWSSTDELCDCLWEVVKAVL